MKLILPILIIVTIVGNVAFLWPKYQQLSNEDYLLKQPTIQAVVDKTAKDAQDKSSQLVSDKDFTYGSPNSAKVFANFYHEVRSETTFRIKVWGKDKQVIWSDLAELIGQKFPDNKEVTEGFAGETPVEIKTNATQGSDKSEILTESLYNNYAEIYVPIKSSGNKVVGIIELYQSLDSTMSDLRSQFYKTAALVISGSVILLIAMAWFLKKALK